ncbi:MurR/RpiR family transcriptional regulator [Mycoplasma crocodyli]|uniref:Hypothetical HTH-type transcriptional regulator, RpiR family n=1 Tax=Mycoplasma crocodyli (strain ATCC 51981 / MP145) TaxID=512564 RepID=D5E587_MYCCM|nr:MurR/RpiR family transcriptional regulator [Mycoplasma crocodyli]ADE19402.1 hypothetical HTH-type transcriptional regulator, RpiR family [Mycoplasma crocodyli MP145]
MMNYDYKLKTKEIPLTQGEKQLIKYFDEYKGDTFTDTIVELAKNADVSTSTISRFVKKISFDTYKDFSKYFNGRMKEFKISKQNEHLSLTDQTGKILDNYTQKLNDSINSDNLDKVTEIAKLILNSNRIILFGSGSKSSVATGMSAELSNVGLTVNLVTNFNNLLSIVANAKSGDVVIVYTNKSNSLEFKFISDFAKNKDIKVIIVTSAPAEQFKKIADIVLSYGSVYFFNKFVTARHDIFADVFTNMILMEILNLSSLCSINYRRAQSARQKWKVYQKTKKRTEIEVN